MGKKLAIKGHPTRGKEVIELLEMMGGKNTYGYTGDMESLYFSIYNDTIIYGSDRSFLNDNYVFFTLEEFLEKYPLKVGDKVMDCFGHPLTIKSMSWSENCETIIYEFEKSNIILIPKYLKAATDNHTKPSKMKNVLAELLEHIKATSKEELKREFDEIESEGWLDVGPTVDEFKAFCECVNNKPKYPTTYEDCCQHLGCDDKIKIQLIGQFIKLINARNAYWKIAGEEMGLDKPWKPDYDSGVNKYGIVCMNGIVQKSNPTTNWERHLNKLFDFPTPEMRDAFYENFKDLIEQCKELL